MSQSHGASVGAFAPDDDPPGLKQNLHVEPQRPMPQIVQVVLYAQTHVFYGRCLSAIAMDLSPAGHSGANLMPDHVAANQLSIQLVVRDRVRTWTHEAHLAL